MLSFRLLFFLGAIAGSYPATVTRNSSTSPNFGRGHVMTKDPQLCEISKNTKHVNQSCEDDAECFDGGRKSSVSCKGGRCACSTGFFPQLLWFSLKDQRLVCLPSAQYEYGEKCESNDQCKEHSGICDNGLCSCDNDYTLETEGNFKYCRRICKKNEVQVDNDRCAPKVELGEKCDPQLPNQCPANAACTDKKICDCYCGYVKLGNESCAPQPICPPIEASKDRHSPAVIVKPTEFVLCRVPEGPQTPGILTVETCPKGEYCSEYVPEYGLCCPMPEKPFCPDGAKPGEKCHPKVVDQCGHKSFCHRYVSPAVEENLNFGYVCCPKSN